MPCIKISLLWRNVDTSCVFYIFKDLSNIKTAISKLQNKTQWFIRWYAKFPRFVGRLAISLSTSLNFAHTLENSLLVESSKLPKLVSILLTFVFKSDTWFCMLIIRVFSPLSRLLILFSNVVLVSWITSWKFSSIWSIFFASSCIFSYESLKHSFISSLTELRSLFVSFSFVFSLIMLVFLVEN